MSPSIPLNPLLWVYTCKPLSSDRKRQKIEALGESQTVKKLTELIGRGKVSVAAACELSQAICLDHPLPHGAIKAFGSLGTNGLHPQNAERDLHRWLKSLFGFKLQPYTLRLGLQINSTKVQTVPVKVLAPHEILHAIATMGSNFAFNSLLLGNLTENERHTFWSHIQSLPPWSSHPIFLETDVKFNRLVGLTIHGDGAVMKRDDECFVWSISSCFSSEGLIKDPLLMKFPVAVIPERHMLSKQAANLNWHVLF